MYDATATVVARFDYQEHLFVAVREAPNGKATVYSIGFGNRRQSHARVIVESYSEIDAKLIDPSVYTKRGIEIHYH